MRTDCGLGRHGPISVVGAPRRSYGYAVVAPPRNSREPREGIRPALIRMVRCLSPVFEVPFAPGRSDHLPLPDGAIDSVTSSNRYISSVSMKTNDLSGSRLSSWPKYWLSIHRQVFTGVIDGDSVPVSASGA